MPLEFLTDATRMLLVRVLAAPPLVVPPALLVLRGFRERRAALAQSSHSEAECLQ